jgi:hypothetical protein
VPKVEKIRGLNLPGTPRATSACRGIPLLYFIRSSVINSDENFQIRQFHKKTIYKCMTSCRNEGFNVKSKRIKMQVLRKKLEGINDWWDKSPG